MPFLYLENKNMDITLPYIEGLTGALEYVYRLRTWLGNGIDVEMWWKFPTGECYFFQSLTGETAEENPVPKICKKTGIFVDKFDLMIKCLVDNGIMELESDTEHGIMTNHNEFYYVLLKDGSSNFFLAMCGHHRNSKFKNIVNILVENIK